MSFADVLQELIDAGGRLIPPLHERNFGANLARVNARTLFRRMGDAVSFLGMLEFRPTEKGASASPAFEDAFEVRSQTNAVVLKLQSHLPQLFATCLTAPLIVCTSALCRAGAGS